MTARAAWSPRMVRALLVALAAVPSIAWGSWFCSVDPQNPQTVKRLFSALEENYLITGVPIHPSATNQVKFQFSIKFDLIPNEGPCGLFFGFTEKSLWRLWDHSGATFDDNNYNPTLFLVWGVKDVGVMTRPPSDRPFKFLWARLGVEHESNGRGSSAEERTWDRIFGSARFGVWFERRDIWYVTFEPKAWIPFVSATGPNPDLLDYVGIGQLTTEAGWNSQMSNGRWHNVNLRVQLRKGLVGAHGSIEASLSYRPPWPAPSFSFYIQGFLGDAVTLIHYNQHTASLQFGIAFDDRFPWNVGKEEGQVQWPAPPP